VSDGCTNCRTQTYGTCAGTNNPVRASGQQRYLGRWHLMKGHVEIRRRCRVEREVLHVTGHTDDLHRRGRRRGLNDLDAFT
jgi:hypothetical protein